jgi:hypothetical protein
VLWVTKDTKGVIWTFGRMYARYSGRTLLSVVQTNGRDHQTYALQTVQADICGTTERTLLFGIPSG